MIVRTENQRMSKHRQSGMNLIELMVTVTIIGIIGSIAYPSYMQNVRQAKRAECSGALLGLSGAMERFYSVNGTYQGAAAGGANTGAPAVFSTTCPADGSATSYNLTISDAQPSTFELRATPVGDQAEDICGTLEFTNRGVKRVVGADTGVTWDQCWR